MIFSIQCNQYKKNIMIALVQIIRLSEITDVRLRHKRNELLKRRQIIIVKYDTFSEHYGKRYFHSSKTNYSFVNYFRYYYSPKSLLHSPITVRPNLHCSKQTAVSLNGITTVCNFVFYRSWWLTRIPYLHQLR